MLLWCGDAFSDELQVQLHFPCNLFVKSSNTSPRHHQLHIVLRVATIWNSFGMLTSENAIRVKVIAHYLGRLEIYYILFHALSVPVSVCSFVALFFMLMFDTYIVC